MPPKKKLADEVIADFEKWVAMGAPDPRDGGGNGRTKHEIDIEKGRKFWSFQPPKKSTPPAGERRRLAAAATSTASCSPSLEAKGLKPVADADPRTLLRRLYFDLTGLPPAPEDVDAFVKEYRGETAGGTGNGRGPAAGVAAVRRALGPALARRGPLRRVERPGRQLRLPPRLALPRLRHRRVQRRQALRPVHPRAAGRRPAARQGRPGRRPSS